MMMMMTTMTIMTIAIRRMINKRTLDKQIALRTHFFNEDSLGNTA